MRNGGVKKDEIQNIKVALDVLRKENNEDPILEFGVFEGYSLSEMLLFLNENNMPNKVYGFDGFCGLPKDEYHWLAGMGASTYENTFNLIEKKVKKIDNLTLIKGIYEDIFEKDVKEKINIDSASLIHIDCDLAGSTEHVLNICKSTIRSGTYIIQHDWRYEKIGKVWKTFVEKNNIEYETLRETELQRVFRIKKI